MKLLEPKVSNLIFSLISYSLSKFGLWGLFSSKILFSEYLNFKAAESDIPLIFLRSSDEINSSKFILFLLSKLSSNSFFLKL